MPAGLLEDRTEARNPENRVLARKGARELTAREIEHVSGGVILRTNTACTFALQYPSPDGDTNECVV